jgi:hypothetical protein
VLLVLLLAVFVTGRAPANVLPVQLLPQTGPVWCWAACTEMVLSYLFGSMTLQQQKIGQCTFAQRVPNGHACRCTPPDGYNATGGCDQPNPFGSGDFLPGLLPPLKTTLQPPGGNLAPNHPIHRDLLTCEIDQRLRPIIAWWGNTSCQRVGHLVVAAGVQRGTTLGDLVLILDPEPQRQGRSNWATWSGFACGMLGGSPAQGHCVDYYDIQDPGAKPSCPAVANDLNDLDPVGCDPNAADSKEKITELSKAAGAIRDLLQGPFAATLRRGLEIENPVNDVRCDLRFLVQGARIGFNADGSPAPSTIGTTRLLCDIQAASEVQPASIFLIDQPGAASWLLAGFGDKNTTRWLQQKAQTFLKQGPQALGKPVHLYEVEIPGTGDLLEIVDDQAAGYPTFRFPEGPTFNDKAQRKLRELLGDPVAGKDLCSLEAWLRGQGDCASLKH